MAALFTDTYRNNLGCRITVKIAEAIKSGELPNEEIHEICAYLLVAVRDMKSFDECMMFLSIISSRWPFLTGIFQEEKKKSSTITGIEDQFAQRAVPAVH